MSNQPCPPSPEQANDSSQLTSQGPYHRVDGVALQDVGNNRIALTPRLEKNPLPPALREGYILSIDLARDLYQRLGTLLESYPNSDKDLT